MDKRVLVWAFDVDGVITTNPDWFKVFTYWLKKKRNNNIVHIVTSRNPERTKETIEELKMWNISYDYIHFMPKDFTRSPASQAKWKKDTILTLNIDLWFDNDFKWYEKMCGIDFSDLDCARIEI